MVSDEARRLYAVVVNELWHKHPELVVPGWTCGPGAEWWCQDGGDSLACSPRDIDILAAAALCAKWLWARDCWTSKQAESNQRYPEDWESAQFAAILAEKGIEHE